MRAPWGTMTGITEANGENHIMKTTGGLIGAAVGLACIWIMVAGCETTKTADSAIAVTPSSMTLTGVHASVTFTAVVGTNTTLVLPLNWSVSEPSLGHILNSVGLSAVYESEGGAGNNTVIVRDQANAEGMAVVNQL